MCYIKEKCDSPKLICLLVYVESLNWRFNYFRHIFCYKAVRHAKKWFLSSVSRSPTFFYFYFFVYFFIFYISIYPLLIHSSIVGKGFLLHLEKQLSTNICIHKNLHQCIYLCNWMSTKFYICLLLYILFMVYNYIFVYVIQFSCLFDNTLSFK